jgi:L-fuconolactonase
VTPGADAHIHLFADGYSGTRGASPAGGDELAVYEQVRARHGIERALVVGYEAEARYAGNTEHVLALAAQRHWIAPLAYLGLAPGDDAPTVEALRDLSARGAVGFSLYLTGEAEGEALATWPREVIAELNAQRAVLSFNACAAGIAAAKATLVALEGCSLLFSHLGLPGRFDEPPPASAARERIAALLDLAARRNVAVKLSGAYAIGPFPHDAARPFVDLLLDAFGPERLLWGSDFSPALDSVTFEQAASAHLLADCTPNEIDSVMGANLNRLLSRE